MIHIMLVGDQASFRQPLAARFEREPNCAIVAEAGSLAEAHAALADSVAAGIDVAVVDVNLLDGGRVELVGELHAANPNGMVLMLSASTSHAQFAPAEADEIRESRESTQTAGSSSTVQGPGVGGSVVSPHEVIESLGLASQHREQRHAAQAALGRLTSREREVLQVLAEGLNDKEIAQQLRISAATVRTHITRILGKLGVDSRLQAVLLAGRHGAVSLR